MVILPPQRGIYASVVGDDVDWGTKLGIIGIGIGLVSLAVAVPPFIQMIYGKARATLDFDESVENGARVLLGRLHNRPISNWFLRRLGVQRDGVAVFVNFDIREHGTNKILASHFRATLIDPKSGAEGLSLILEEPVPLIFVLIQHSDGGATTANSAPGERRNITIPPGEYFVEIQCGSRYGALRKRKSLTVGEKKELTFWTFRDTN